MLTFKLEEIEKLLSTLSWVQAATLSTQEDREILQSVIDKLYVIKKTNDKKEVEVRVK